VSGAGGPRGLRCTLKLLPSLRMLEFAAFGGAAAELLNWPLAPGGVRRGAQGRPEMLHFAPARWLLPEPDASSCAAATAAEAAGTGTAVDVEGKWSVMTLEGADARRLLSASLDVAAVLGSRDCAAVALFDCPAVLTASAERYWIFLKASYAADFRAAVLRLCADARSAG
jgi:heterotetrameric sarcosine oxidase gamma subunit